MKNTKFLLFAGLLCLLAVACKKDEGGFEKTLDKFVVGNTDFKSEDNSKVALDFSGNRLLYEEGDYIKVNGANYTLSKSGSGDATVWYANGPGVTAENFYCAYADGVTTTLSGYTEGGSSYHFDLAGRLSSPTNKILLGGVTESNILTLRPACAIIRIVLNDSYSNVKVAFENTKVAKSGTMNITSSEVTISPETYMTGVTEGSGTTGGGADFLSMEHDATNGYWYVAVPVTSSSINTTLYFYWELGGSPVGWKTTGRVTLTKGYVYTVGATRQTPFNANGTSKNYFQVGPSTYVQFSPGNLQAVKTIFGNDWQFASTQLEALGSTGASAITGGVGSTWDLFGFGTSNYNSGVTNYSAGSYQNVPANYIQQSLTGSYASADWGVNNGTGILYQGSPSGTTWRTLTNSEWTYLISSRTDKVALATVNDIKGVLLLPDVAASGRDQWEMPTGISLNYSKSGYGDNTISSSTWNTLEAAGVIFLPITGYRQGTSHYGTSEGHYWSSTYNTNYMAYCLFFNASGVSVTSSSKLTSQGRAVRLVHAL